jgi:hypothetical protein
MRPPLSLMSHGFAGYREHRGVAEEALLSRRVRLRPVAKDTLELRPQALDGAPGLPVAGVGLEVSPDHAPGLERILKEQQLCLDIDARSLRRSGQPGPADLPRARDASQAVRADPGIGTLRRAQVAGPSPGQVPQVQADRQAATRTRR